MNKKQLLLAITIVLAVSLTLTACTTETSDKAQDTTEDIKQDVEDTTEDAKDKVGEVAKDLEDNIRNMTYEDITVTPEEAFDKFMELHPNSKITQIDLDKELMEYQYVVEGYDSENDYEVKINPVNGEIISDDSEVAEMDKNNLQITKDHLAKVESIINKAKVEDGSDSELDEWNIDIDDGRVVMEVEIGVTEYSYDMDTEELIEKDM